jgi:hypothetical protein
MPHVLADVEWIPYRRIWDDFGFSSRIDLLDRLVPSLVSMTADKVRYVAPYQMSSEPLFIAPHTR